MTTARDVVENDLDSICDALTDDLATLGGEKLLITGGAGFLGYYMVQAIVHWNRLHDPSRRISLTVLDNFMRGVPSWLTEMDDQPGLTLLRRSILEPLPEDFPEFKAVVHAAGIASPVYYRRYPIETMDANVKGLRQLLDGCVERSENGNPIEAMLYFSTSEIYGDPTPENIPTPETYRGNVSCTGPRACYDESKRFGETLCVSFAEVHDIPVKVARPFNNYGPGLKISDGRVIPDFARDILAGRDIVMKSDGSPTRTFCYSADAVVGYYKVLLRGRKGEAYNIGVEAPEISMRNLADRLAAIAGDLFGYKGRVVCQAEVHQDYLVDNPNRRCPVISKARTELGYDPGTGLDEGLLRSMIWYGNNREAEDS